MRDLWGSDLTCLAERDRVKTNLYGNHGGNSQLGTASPSFTFDTKK